MSTDREVRADGETGGSGGEPVRSPAPVDVRGWISANRNLIDRGAAGPMLTDGELEVLVVAGRGPRGDYHVNSLAELFYQLDGDIVVIVRERGEIREVTVRAGELWIAPAGIPHSPQRPVGSLGLVIERVRDSTSTEAFRWYCEACGAVVHDIVPERVDPVALRAAMAAFYASVEARTCRSCGEIVRAPGA